ncbi:MAG: hypothetical protein U0L17_02105 [Acutalibacteraceae bacterium]|nr:hypothetical protein [Acutalibacteraceae bacterium]
MKKMIKFISLCMVIIAMSAVGFSASASSSNPVSSDITASNVATNLYKNNKLVGRGSDVKTTVGYKATWVRASSEVQKYPSGSTFIANDSATANNAKSARYIRAKEGYTGKITIYGAHSVRNNGKTAIKYTTKSNV